MSWIYFWLCVLSVLVDGRRTPPEGTCTFSRVFKMLGADCSNKYLINIPTNISSKKIEVLDATINRIRTLRNTSFLNFDYLRFLYLADNSISTIEPGTFAPLPQLEVLDLSLNSIRDIPALLPPALRRLYLSENNLEHVPLQQAVALQFLSLAECSLTSIPEVGELPCLQELNLTGNPLQRLSVHQLASFCQLEALNLPASLWENSYAASCDCVNVVKWTSLHSIFVHPALNCTVQNETECMSNWTAEAEAFESCQVAYQQYAKMHWAVVAGAAGAIIVCLIILTILWRRRWRKKRTPPPQLNEVEDGKNSKLLRNSKTKPTKF